MHKLQYVGFSLDALKLKQYGKQGADWCTCRSCSIFWALKRQKMRGVDSLHPSSSLWSPQSLSPSHCHWAGMQVHSPNALTAHVKWFLPHEHSVLLWTPAHTHTGWKGGKSVNALCFLMRRNIKVIFFWLMGSVTVSELQTTDYCNPMEHRPGAFTIYVFMVCAETFSIQMGQ